MTAPDMAAIAARTMTRIAAAREAGALYDGRPDYTGPMGRDADGYLVRRSDGMDFRLTECCHASAKGCEDGTCCRACYALIDPAIGGTPRAPYIGEGGGVVATVVCGWDGWPS